MTGEPGKVEKTIGFSILALLALIAVGVYLEQLHFDPAVFSPPTPEGSHATGVAQKPPSTSDLQSFVPAELAPLTPSESFGADNLSDKIDGKAELYLSSGFVGLQCRRFFSPARGKESWMELFVYDMGKMRSAFSVFSAQRRADAQQLEGLTRFAYKAGNALFFVHGRYYVEIVSAAHGMDEEMSAIARNFIERRPVVDERLDESSLFPRDRLIDGSISLHAANVFGSASLENVFTAGYDFGKLRLTAYLARRESQSDASEAAEAYHRFLLENGGVDEEHSMEIPGARLLLMFDTFEIIFHHDGLLAGVHEAESRPEAEALAIRLYKEILEAGK